MAEQTNTIRIVLGESGWLALFEGPHAKRIGELFDTCALPTPYTAQTSKAHVVAAVAQLNPECTVF